MANIKVNAADWKSAEKHHAEITSIMKKNGFLTGDEKIEGDEGAPKAAEVVKASSSHLSASAAAYKAASTSTAAKDSSSTCKTICDLAEGAAVVACQSLPPPFNLVCVAVAHAGGKLCRSNCK